ncbi:MAG: hypothetical protein FWG43_06070 [Clostridiales bacterium]|nr:hypothetical protein [Clostridiales bacterium]
MKKFAKFVFICGSILFLGGLLLALTCLALGSDPSIPLQHLNQIGIIHINGSDYGKQEAQKEWLEWEINLPELPSTPDLTTWPDWPEEQKLPKSNELNSYDIKQLDFDFGLGDVYIIRGEDFGLIYGNNNTHRLYYEKKSGATWTIKSNKIRWRFLTPWSRHDKDIHLTVVLPYDFVAENMTIILGAGSVRAEYLQAQELQLDVGLGNCQIGSLYAELASLKVGVGNLEARHFFAKQAQLEVGLGNMELSLTQPLEQFYCHVEVGLGNIKLGGNSYSGVADVYTGAENAPYALDLNCGLGNISIKEDDRI